MQHLQPWVSVALAQAQEQGQQGMQLTATRLACANVPRSSCEAVWAAWNPMSWREERYLGVCNSRLAKVGMPYSWCLTRQGSNKTVAHRAFRRILHRYQLKWFSFPICGPYVLWSAN